MIIKYLIFITNMVVLYFHSPNIYNDVLAMHLEDQGKFKEAENAFILSGKPREAILMYIHNQDWTNALAISEAYDPSSITEILAGQAKVAFEKKENSKAEALLLRAQRPDLAIKFYKESQQWKEAIRFSKEYLPSKVAEIIKEYESASKKGESFISLDELLLESKSYEQQKDYTMAIETLLKLNPDMCSDYDLLEEQWQNAIKLSAKFLPEKLVDVSRAVCIRLIQIKRFESAGSIFLVMELYKEAIDAFVAGNLWDQAMEIVKKVPKYSDYLDNLKKKITSTTDSLSHITTESSLTSGDLDVLAKKGEWEKCIELAFQQVQQFLKYLKHSQSFQ